MLWRLFEGVPQAEVDEVLRIARRRRFDRDEIVFHEGDPADCLHLVAKGRFAIRRSGPRGDWVILGVRVPGESFGELALIGGDAVRSATVAALEAAETRAVYRDDFHRLRRHRPSVTDILLSLMAKDIGRMNERLVEALFVSAEDRVRRRLVELSELYGEEPPTVVPLRQEELAALAGTSRATVNRVLREEQERGSVELQRGRTVVLDRASLQRRGR